MGHERAKKVIRYIFIIAAIIAVVVFIVHYIIGVVKKEKIKEMQADLLSVQAKVEIIKGKNSVNKDENPLKGISVSKIAEKIGIVKNVFEKYEITGDELAKYYVLKDTDLTEMDLKELVGKNSGSYIVNYDSYEVFYTKGYTNANGLFCYKVSEMNKQPEIKKIVPVSSNETQETSAEATENKTEETKAEEENTNTQTTENSETAENNETTETNETTEITEEQYNAILNHSKNLIK